MQLVQEKNNDHVDNKNNNFFCLAQTQLQQQDTTSRQKAPKQFWPARYGWQCMGMVHGLL